MFDIFATLNFSFALFEKKKKKLLTPFWLILQNENK